MICVVVQGYSQACGAVAGGISRMWVGDPNDFDFTQAVATDEFYTAVARMAGATQVGGGNLFPVQFVEEEAELKSVKTTTSPVAIKYEHSVEAQLPALSKEMNAFLVKMDSSSICCGLIVVVELNNGKIFVIGEKYVNTAAVPLFKVRLTDVNGTSGKKWDDFNGATVTFKGNYIRPAREFTGGAAAIEAMEPA